MARFVIKLFGKTIKEVCYENRLVEKKVKENQLWMREENGKRADQKRKNEINRSTD